jgi:hypothetical protein
MRIDRFWISQLVYEMRIDDACRKAHPTALCHPRPLAPRPRHHRPGHRPKRCAAGVSMKALSLKESLLTHEAVMDMNTQTHWEKIYTEKAPDAVSWYRPHLETSLALIEKAAAGISASVIDVGGGVNPHWSMTFSPADMKTSPSSIFPRPPSRRIRNDWDSFGACPLACCGYHDGRPRARCLRCVA